MIFLQVYELLWKCLPQKWHGMSEAWPSFVSVIQLFRSDPEMYSCFFTSHLNSQWQKLWFQWWITIKWHDKKTCSHCGKKFSILNLNFVLISFHSGPREMGQDLCHACSYIWLLDTDFISKQHLLTHNHKVFKLRTHFYHLGSNLIFWWNLFELFMSI